MPEEFVADTIVRLRIEPIERAVLRSIEVIKSRGQEFEMGRHSFRIVDGRVELVDKTAQDGYTVIVEQPQPERLVVRFYKPDAP